MDSERGQALPLAMMALAFGALVITPFLSYAGSSLTSSRIYKQGIAELYSCDSGIEHAIWSLTNGGLAEALPFPGDEVTYELGEAVNGIAPGITVTANVTGDGGGAIGEIADNIIDTFDFGPDGGEPAKIINVAGDVYAIVYTDSGTNGWVKTVEVAGDGTITGTAIDSLAFETKKGNWIDIIHVSGHIYAVAYQGKNNDGLLKTIEIAPGGMITDTVIDTLEFDEDNCIYPEIVHISGDIFAIAYEGKNNDGSLKTVAIASDGEIADSAVDSLEFDDGNGREPDIIYVSGDIYAVAYRGNNRDGHLKTIEIASDGEITNEVVDAFEFNRYECNFPSLCHISGDVFAIAYDGDSAIHGVWGGGILTTVEIAVDGTITGSIVDEAVFDSDTGDCPDIIHVGGNVYAIAYAGPDVDGWLKTVTVGADGIISGDIIDSLEFDNHVGYYPDIIHIAGDVFAIAYTGTSQWHGILKTVEIATTTAGETAAAYRIVATAGDTVIRAFINIEDDAVFIVSWQAE
jgi:hypothetical protein